MEIFLLCGMIYDDKENVLVHVLASLPINQLLFIENQSLINRFTTQNCCVKTSVLFSYNTPTSFYYLKFLVQQEKARNLFADNQSNYSIIVCNTSHFW